MQYICQPNKGSTIVMMAWKHDAVESKGILGCNNNTEGVGILLYSYDVRYHRFFDSDCT